MMKKSRFNIKLKDYQGQVSLQKRPDSLDYYLLGIVLFVTLLIPGIHVTASFYLNLEELIVPILGVRLLQKAFFWIDYYVLGLAAFSLVILLTIVLNPRYLQLGEYFEIYKMLKFTVLYVYAFFVFSNKPSAQTVINFVSFLFLCVATFNLIHYFDLFKFNTYCTILYDSDGRDTLLFGKNSIGEPGPKRIVGTMGNPNMNAIVFLLFFSFFSFLILEKKNEKSSWNIGSSYKAHALMMMSAYFVILCQSRTALVAMGVIFILTWFFRRNSIQVILSEMAMLIGFYALIYFSNPMSVNYIASTQVGIEGFEENSSLQGRKASWVYFFNQWKSNPILGYGPNKGFVYANNLHPESQYLFYAWRYGLLGLACLFFLLFYPAACFIKQFAQYSFIWMVSLVIGVTSLMSNPIDNSKIALLFAICIGFSFGLHYSNTALLTPSKAVHK